MSRAQDARDEGTRPLDDEAVEALLRGDPPPAGLEGLAVFVRVLRELGSGPVRPSEELARRMATGDFGPAGPVPVGADGRAATPGQVPDVPMAALRAQAVAPDPDKGVQPVARDPGGPQSAGRGATGPSAPTGKRLGAVAAAARRGATVSRAPAAAPSRRRRRRPLVATAAASAALALTGTSSAGFAGVLPGTLQGGFEAVVESVSPYQFPDHVPKPADAPSPAGVPPAPRTPTPPPETVVAPQQATQAPPGLLARTPAAPTSTASPDSGAPGPPGQPPSHANVPTHAGRPGPPDEPPGRQRQPRRPDDPPTIVGGGPAKGRNRTVPRRHRRPTRWPAP